MAGELHAAAEVAGILKVRESWLKTKASARLIPCTFVGKHLRFSDDAQRWPPPTQQLRPPGTPAACDGRYAATPGRYARVVITDQTTWPGIPIAAWVSRHESGH